MKVTTETKIELPDIATTAELTKDIVAETVIFPFVLVGGLFDWITGE